MITFRLRPTARLRLTALYGGLSFVSGTALLALTYALVERAIGGPNSIAVSPSTSAQSLQIAQAAAAQQQRISDLNQLLMQSGIALTILAVLAVVLGWFVAGRVLRPLSTITTTAQRISASNLSERLALHGPNDELKDLSNTLDDLFARLEASFDAQRHFVANASHELRTPVTRERTLLQVALADPDTSTEMWRSVSQELLASNREQERLIEALLTLASIEGRPNQREPVDLSSLTARILTRSRDEIERLGLQVETALQAAVIPGDPVLLERMMINLIDNAVRHNVTGGRIVIAIRSQQGDVVLSVINTGPVIPDEAIDRLFQPFQRLDGRHVRRDRGHGVGLAIVRAIATAHGAGISAQAVPSGGLAIDVSFPPDTESGDDSCQASSRRRAVVRPTT